MSAAMLTSWSIFFPRAPSLPLRGTQARSARRAMPKDFHLCEDTPLHVSSKPSVTSRADPAPSSFSTVLAPSVSSSAVPAISEQHVAIMPCYMGPVRETSACSSGTLTVQPTENKQSIQRHMAVAQYTPTTTSMFAHERRVGLRALILRAVSARTPEPLDDPKPLPVTPSRMAEWDERKLGTTPQIKHLFCSAKQEAALREIYANQQHFARTYTSGTQDKAQEVLKRHGLDHKALQSLESRWKMSGTSGRRNRVSTQETVVRAIFQCACGYDTDARQRRGGAKTDATNAKAVASLLVAVEGDSESASLQAMPVVAEEGAETAWKRRAPYPFTGCLAHADVTFVENSGFVLRIQAVFEHNAACQSASMVRFPAIPLHPHVVELALEQLRGNASVSQIRNKNLELLEATAYRDQRGAQAAVANHRYNLLTSDFRSLYRRHYRDHFGVDINVAPEYNVHNWLDPDSKFYKPAIKKAVFSYAARTRKEERLKVCISTTEMRQAAWRYCHDAQLILDGTFGLCDSRVLLWIAMGVDEGNRGMPVALFLFSAPTGNKATHAGYDTTILIELIRSWRDWLSLPDHAPPVVSGQILKLLNSPWRSRVEAALRALEEALLDSHQHEDALRLLSREEVAFSQAATGDAEEQKAATAIQDFVCYLRGTWMPKEMWYSWSKRGRMDAATLMDVALERVLTTSNHLESFNGNLKGAHITQWQHSGRRLRFDVLIYHLATDILPRIYARHRVATAYVTWKVERFRQAAGGMNLYALTADGATAQRANGSYSAPQIGFVPHAWYTPDARRDLDARTLFDEGHLCPVAAAVAYELWATCRSSQDPTQHYSLTVHPSGEATCTCLDWQKRGGACKHLRAFRLLIEAWGRGGQLPHQFLFPLTEAEAVSTEERNRQWYGDAYGAAVSSPASAGLAELTPSAGNLSATPSLIPQLSQALCLLPPAHLDDDLPPASIDAAIELEAIVDEALESTSATDFQGSTSVTPTYDPEPVVRSLRAESGDLAVNSSSIVQIQVVSSGSPTMSASHRAVNLQVQAHLEADAAFLLPRLHGMNSTLRAHHHDAWRRGRSIRVFEHGSSLIAVSFSETASAPQTQRSYPSTPVPGAEAKA
ncbi:hypothetical protein C8Q73DRAFT_664898 [Cubamyces lactineus]|nr:hypothetical protein C8Q73DRAFT_664898 [Cubamyces lactineus]